MSGFASRFYRFGADDCGAVTIDWVALTSGILLVGIMVVYSIFGGGVGALVGEINLTLTELGSDVATDFAENIGAGDGSDGSSGGDGPIATGQANQRACENTLKYVVCVGNK